MVTHCPTDIPKVEELIQDHHQLKVTYQEMYSSVRMDGHKLIEMMRKPIGESSLPLNFIVGTRHVKEILESSYDEKSWLDEQWGRRDLMLRQALNLRKFQEQAQKVGVRKKRKRRERGEEGEGGRWGGHQRRLEVIGDSGSHVIFMGGSQYDHRVIQ